LFIVINVLKQNCYIVRVFPIRNFIDACKWLLSTRTSFVAFFFNKYYIRYKITPTLHAHHSRRLQIPLEFTLTGQYTHGLVILLSISVVSLSYSWSLVFSRKIWWLCLTNWKQNLIIIIYVVSTSFVTISMDHRLWLSFVIATHKIEIWCGGEKITWYWWSIHHGQNYTPLLNSFIKMLLLTAYQLVY